MGNLRCLVEEWEGGYREEEGKKSGQGWIAGRGNVGV